MQKITPAFANSCKKEYDSYMEKLGVDVQKNQTNCVCFSTDALKAYLENNKVFENSDEIRVFFGVYPADAPGVYPGTIPGRITTILWPHKGGKPALNVVEGGDGGEIEPFDTGTLMP